MKKVTQKEALEDAIIDVLSDLQQAVDDVDYLRAKLSQLRDLLKALREGG